MKIKCESKCFKLGCFFVYKWKYRMLMRKYTCSYLNLLHYVPDIGLLEEKDKNLLCAKIKKSF